MQPNDVFRINTPQVIYENIDGEVVLINLERGLYYSTDQVGAEIWDLIEAGRSVRELREAILARYAGDGEQIDEALSDFISELRKEELIVAGTAAATERVEPRRPAGGSATERPAFPTPVLNKYTDMKDMLLLDPIHDVEESGWPAPRVVEEPPPTER
jgi:Coenzyme PQQ synthesis protein D (PqqD)